MTTAPEAVVFVQFAWADMDFRLRILDRRGPGFAAEHRTAQCGGTRQHRAGHSTAAQKTATTESGLLFVLHGLCGFFVSHAAYSLKG
ncbi:hypothetical protein D3C71_1712050 [compost metagenome]